MDRWRAAGALLALAACFACSAAAPTASNHTALDLYNDAPEGCYYNFQHYGEGDRIMTNEPCLNCTCHNRMLMCYLRVCPFTKPIGQDCTVEKRADQCCPIITCPDVPVDLLTSTSTTSPAEYGATGIGKHDKYGCSINGKYFAEGSKVPPTPNKPCEHCYCIRNMTSCVMQECTLHVDGCTPIYHKDVCCPIRYSCGHPEDDILLLDDMMTTVRPTPGFLLTTTTVSPVTEISETCIHNGEVIADGAVIDTGNACDNCYCMQSDIVCVVQECGAPMETEGKNCTSQPPRHGQCCPDTYICDDDEQISEIYPASTTESVLEELTTLSPPRRVGGGGEGSGYRIEPDEAHVTPSTTDLEVEGSGEEHEIVQDATELSKPDDHVTHDDGIATTEEIHEFISVTTKKTHTGDIVETTEGFSEQEHGTSSSDAEDKPESHQPTSTTVTSDDVQEKDHETTEAHKEEASGSGPIIEDDSSELPQYTSSQTIYEHVDDSKQSTTKSSQEDALTTQPIEISFEHQQTTHKLPSDDEFITHTTKGYEQDTATDDYNEENISDSHPIISSTMNIPSLEDIEGATTERLEQNANEENEQEIFEHSPSRTTIIPPTAETETETNEISKPSTITDEHKEQSDLDQPIYGSTSSPELDDENITSLPDEEQQTESNEIQQKETTGGLVQEEFITLIPEIHTESDTSDTTKNTPEPQELAPSTTISTVINEATTVSVHDEDKESSTEIKEHLEPESDVTIHPLVEDENTPVTVDETSTEHSSESEQPSMLSTDAPSGEKEQQTLGDIESTTVYKDVDDFVHDAITTSVPLTDEFVKSTTESVSLAEDVSGVDDDGSKVHELLPSTTASYNEIEIHTSKTDNTEQENVATHDYVSSTSAAISDGETVEGVTESLMQEKTTVAAEKEVDEYEPHDRESTPGVGTTSADIGVSREDQYTITTEKTIPKHEDSETSTSIQDTSEITTEKSDQGPTQDESSSQKSTVYDEISTTDSAPQYTNADDTLIPKEPTSFSEATTIKESHPAIESVTQPETTAEHPSSTLAPAIYDSETTIINVGENEIHEDVSLSPGRIPGEGDCLLNGVTYENDSAVPNTNNCHTGCRCVSSIIKCDPIICSPPPSYMDNCQPMYDSHDSCCPTYICDHSRETIPPQPHSQMSGTEVPTPAIECRGDQCEIKDKVETSESTPEKEHSPQEYPTDCLDGKCSQTESCANGKCQLTPVQETLCNEENGCQVAPVKPCEGLECLDVPSSEKTQPCENGGECKNLHVPVIKDCGTGDCTTNDIPQTVVDPEKDCTEESCRRKETSDIESHLPTECTELGCKKQTPEHEIDIEPSTESSIIEKTTQFATEQEIQVTKTETPKSDVAESTSPAYSNTEYVTSHAEDITEPQDLSTENKPMPEEPGKDPHQFESDVIYTEPHLTTESATEFIEIETSSHKQETVSEIEPDQQDNYPTIEQDYNTEIPESLDVSTEIPKHSDVDHLEKETKTPVEHELSTEIPKHKDEDSIAKATQAPGEYELTTEIPKLTVEDIIEKETKIPSEYESTTEIPTHSEEDNIAKETNAPSEYELTTKTSKVTIGDTVEKETNAPSEYELATEIPKYSDEDNVAKETKAPGEYELTTGVPNLTDGESIEKETKTPSEYELTTEIPKHSDDDNKAKETKAPGEYDLTTETPGHIVGDNIEKETKAPSEYELTTEVPKHSDEDNIAKETNAPSEYELTTEIPKLTVGNNLEKETKTPLEYESTTEIPKHSDDVNIATATPTPSEYELTTDIPKHTVGENIDKETKTPSEHEFTTEISKLSDEDNIEKETKAPGEYDSITEIPNEADVEKETKAPGEYEIKTESSDTGSTETSRVQPESQESAQEQTDMPQISEPIEAQTKAPDSEENTTPKKSDVTEISEEHDQEIYTELPEFTINEGDEKDTKPIIISMDEQETSTMYPDTEISHDMLYTKLPEPLTTMVQENVVTETYEKTLATEIPEVGVTESQERITKTSEIPDHLTENEIHIESTVAPIAEDIRTESPVPVITINDEQQATITPEEKVTDLPLGSITTLEETATHKGEINIDTTKPVSSNEESVEGTTLRQSEDKEHTSTVSYDTELITETQTEPISVSLDDIHKTESPASQEIITERDDHIYLTTTRTEHEVSVTSSPDATEHHIDVTESNYDTKHTETPGEHDTLHVEIVTKPTEDAINAVQPELETSEKDEQLTLVTEPEKSHIDDINAHKETESPVFSDEDINTEQPNIATERIPTSQDKETDKPDVTMEIGPNVLPTSEKPVFEIEETSTDETTYITIPEDGIPTEPHKLSSEAPVTEKDLSETFIPDHDISTGIPVDTETKESEKPYITTEQKTTTETVPISDEVHTHTSVVITTESQKLDVNDNVSEEELTKSTTTGSKIYDEQTEPASIHGDDTFSEQPHSETYTEVPVSLVTEAAISSTNIDIEKDKDQDQEQIHSTILPIDISLTGQDTTTKNPEIYSPSDDEHVSHEDKVPQKEHDFEIPVKTHKPSELDVTEEQSISTESYKPTDMDVSLETKGPEKTYTDEHDLYTHKPLVTDSEEITPAIPEVTEGIETGEDLQAPTTIAPSLVTEGVSTEAFVTESHQNKVTNKETTIKQQEEGTTEASAFIETEQPETSTTISGQDVTEEKYETELTTEISEKTPVSHIDDVTDSPRPTETITEISEDEDIKTLKPNEETTSQHPVELEEYTHRITEASTTVASISEEATTKHEGILETSEHQLPEATTPKTADGITEGFTSIPEVSHVDVEMTTHSKTSTEQAATTVSDIQREQSTQSSISFEETSSTPGHYVDDKDIVDKEDKYITTSQPTEFDVHPEPTHTSDAEKSSTTNDELLHTDITATTTTTTKPLHHVTYDTTPPEEEFILATTRATTTTKVEEEIATSSPVDKFTKPEEKPAEIPSTHAPELPKPGAIEPTDEVQTPEEESHFPPSGTSGYGQEPDYGDEDQAFGPGTCRYGGKVYVSAQQIPRDDPCDFCFCFRSDIICLQQSCPPPIHGCHEEPIQGFCCPRYECPVSMATTLNVTTTTTTTTTTLPPHFPTHSYKGAAQRRGCQIKGHTYKVGEVVRASSGPCLHCTCGGDGQMKCDPKACTPEPMLRQMIAAAVSAKRRR